MDEKEDAANEGLIALLYIFLFDFYNQS